MDKLVREPNEGNAWHADHKVAVYLGGGVSLLQSECFLLDFSVMDGPAASVTERLDNAFYIWLLI